MSIVFAATYPERTSALILYGAFARRTWAPDYLWGQTDEQLTARRSQRNGARVIPLTQPLHSLANDQELRRFEGRMERSGASPGAAQALMRINQAIDVRHVLPTISVPTLVLHRTGDLDSQCGARSIHRPRAMGGGYKSNPWRDRIFPHRPTPRH